VNSKEENSSDFCLDFVQEFGLRSRFREHVRGSPVGNASKTACYVLAAQLP
jgi:hypothetical protein